MANLIDTFGPLSNFNFVDGVFQCSYEEPIQFFVQKGMKPADFKSWISDISNLRLLSNPDYYAHVKTIENLPDRSNLNIFQKEKHFAIYVLDDYAVHLMEDVKNAFLKKGYVLVIIGK